MKIWEFVPPEGSCYNYLVKADSRDLAKEKFIKWQNESLEGKWPEEIVKEKDNWWERAVIE